MGSMKFGCTKEAFYGGMYGGVGMPLAVKEESESILEESKHSIKN